MTTETLICAIAHGDKSSFEILYRNLRRPMLAYAVGILAGDKEAAEDVVDEAFMGIWKTAASFSGAGNADGWVRRIVRNKAVDWIRAQKKDRMAETPDNHLSYADLSPNPEEAAIAADDRNWVRMGLSHLNISQREALILCYFEERPLSEVAEIMGCPESTVKTKLFYARQKLRNLSAFAA